MRKGKFNVWAKVIVIFTLSFSFLLLGLNNLVGAKSLNNEESFVMTEEELQALKDEGLIGDEVSLEDLYDANELPIAEDFVEKIDFKKDNLTEYGLATDQNGELIDLYKPGYETSVIGYFYPNSSISAQSGDILITNSTSSNGLFGHAGIVVSDGINYASIRNNKSKPKVESLYSWFEDYPNTKVIRINSSAKARLAGEWAKKYVKNNSNAKYKINLAINSLDPTYCSKIVWQAFAKTSNAVGKAGSTIKAPYGFLKKSSYKNGVTAKRIYQKGSNFGGGDF